MCVLLTVCLHNKCVVTYGCMCTVSDLYNIHLFVGFHLSIVHVLPGRKGPRNSADTAHNSAEFRRKFRYDSARYSAESRVNHA